MPDCPENGQGGEIVEATPRTCLLSKRRGLKRWQYFPGSSNSKEFTYNAGDMGSIPGLGRSLGEGNDKPLQYSCLEDFMDRGAWCATGRAVVKSRTQLRN